MAVITEYFRTREDGVVLNRTYSDLGLDLMRNDGVIYNEAVDVVGCGYTYTEVEIPEEEIIEEEV